MTGPIETAGRGAYRAGMAVAVLAAFLIVWTSIVRDDGQAIGSFMVIMAVGVGWFAAGFLALFAFFGYFAPNFLGHPDNYIPANPLATPAHIVPEWYFWPFYAILRAFTVDWLCSDRS